MQIPQRILESEARQRLPALLADLLGEPASSLRFEPSADERVDFVLLDTAKRRWLCEVKGSSGPAQIASVAERLRDAASSDGIPVVVVPFMTPAGASAAARLGLNWIDLAGNARIRAGGVRVVVEGRPDWRSSRGRPSSPFAPRSARVTRALLSDASRWWRQRDLVAATGLNDGSVSRVVRRLDQELLLERRGRELRPRDPDALLDAWAQDYRFTAHDVVPAHVSGSGIEAARELGTRLGALGLRYAFTGLPAAWAIDQFASFRLASVYVDGDARETMDRLELRPGERGANVQLVCPNDDGVFDGAGEHDALSCASAVQVYLDLLHLPERAAEAAEHLRSHHLRWQHAAA